MNCHHHPAALPAWLAAAVALALLVLAHPAHAEDVSLLHRDRLAFGVGADVDWYAADPSPPLQQEVSAGARGAYALTRHVALAGFGTYGFGNRVWRAAPELRVRLDTAGEAFALSLGYEFTGGDADRLPEFHHEWSVGALYARPLWKSLQVGLGVRYGLDNKIARTSLGLRLPLAVGRDH